MRRRSKHLFEEQIRYYQVAGPQGPGAGNTPPVSARELQQINREVQTLIRNTNRAISQTTDPNQARDILLNSAQRLDSILAHHGIKIPNFMNPFEQAAEGIPHDHLPCDVDHMVQHFLGDTQNIQNNTSGENPFINILNPPQTQLGQNISNAFRQNLLGSTLLNQESLRVFFTNSSLAQGQMPGALLSLPLSTQVGYLLAFASSAESPALRQALATAQQVLPALLSDANAASLNKLLNNLSRVFSGNLQTLNQSLSFLKEVLGHPSLSSMNEVGQFLKGMVHQLSSSQNTAGLDQMRQLTQRLLQFLPPNTVGVKEMMGGSFANSALGSLINNLSRSLMGFLLMNPQNQWPKTLPNEALMNELAALFGAAYAKQEKDDKKSKRRMRRQDEASLHGYYSIFEEQNQDEEANEESESE
ncbi:MAG: hypothetical protein JNK65_02870 [Deltaproteobacteria bacterium]|nr:hypothetical protein [Deltaproteobacteria bacterium]